MIIEECICFLVPVVVFVVSSCRFCRILVVTRVASSMQQILHSPFYILYHDSERLCSAVSND